MTKDRKYLWILAGLVVALVLVEYFKPKPLDWTPTLSAKDKIPFGTFVLNDVLSDIFPGKEMVNVNHTLYEISEIQTDTAQNIFILATSFGPDSLDMDALLKMVAAGRQAFIAASFFGTHFADTLHLQAGFELNVLIRDETQITGQKDSASLHFVNPHLDTGAYYYQAENVSDYFTSFDTTRTTVLAVNEKKKPVYLKTTWGKGAFYLSSVPLAYTNYYLLKKNNYEYVAQSLSYLPIADMRWTEYYQQGRFESSSPLRFILSNPSLRWGFYITISGLLLFIAFEVKRKQRMIPVMVPPKNTTLEFVKTVGNLFYRTQNHKNIAHKKITYFLNHIRTHYRLDTSHFDEEFREKLEKKTGKPREEVDALVNLLQTLGQQKTISKEELLALNRKIDVFYENG
jgi:hypothetical protein